MDDIVKLLDWCSTHGAFGVGILLGIALLARDVVPVWLRKRKGLNGEATVYGSLDKIRELVTAGVTRVDDLARDFNTHKNHFEQHCKEEEINNKEVRDRFETNNLAIARIETRMEERREELNSEKKSARSSTSQRHTNRA